MNFMSSRAAKQAADEMKTVREDLTIRTDDGAAFPSASAHSALSCIIAMICTDCSALAYYGNSKLSYGP